MASWAWESTSVHDPEDMPTINRQMLYIEHDGRVVVTVDGPTAADSTITVDADDFEEMCKSFIERMAEWRARG